MKWNMDIFYLKSAFILNFGPYFIGKLDGVGPVDNRPSTDKLHPFV